MSTSRPSALSFAVGLPPAARKGAVILALLLLVVLGLAVGLFAWHGAIGERITTQQAEHDLIAARAARKAQEGAGDGVEQMFLTGATPGLMLAAFQERVGESAARSGLTVVRIQGLETGDAEGKIPFRLGMDAEGSITQMRDFLVDIEASLPVMFVSGLELRPQAAVTEADAFPAEALRASFRIEAYGWGAKQ
jgi:hypothetical protein